MRWTRSTERNQLQQFKLRLENLISNNTAIEDAVFEHGIRLAVCRTFGLILFR